MRRLEINKWFSLPRVGTECFAELRRARVTYDPKFGFKFTAETDVQRALSSLSAALPDEFEIQSSCFICGAPLGENEMQGAILGTDCVGSDEAYALYTMKFARLMDQV